MLITICGMPGSGKTTVSKLVAEKLGYKHVSVGDLRGQIAQEHNMTIDELNAVGLKEDWTDKETDKKTIELGKKEDDLVIDAWLAWNFIPNSLKMYLDCDLRVAAERIFKNQRSDEQPQESVDGVLRMIKARLENTVARYKKWYNVDWHDKSNYDVVIDTTTLTPEEVIDRILEEVNKRK